MDQSGAWKESWNLEELERASLWAQHKGKHADSAFIQVKREVRT